MNKRIFSATSAAAAILLVAGCSSGGGTKSSTSSSASAGASVSAGSVSGDYVIGFVDNLTGPYAAYGAYQLSYIDAAVDLTNQRGGIKGHKIRVTTADSAASGQSASSAAQQLVKSNKVMAIMGSLKAADCASVAQVVEANNIPEFCFSIPDALLSPVQKYVYSESTAIQRMGQPAATFAQQNLKLPSGTTYATISTDAAGSVADLAATKAVADEFGYKLVDAEQVPSAAPNANSAIAKVVAAKPQVVFVNFMNSQLLPLVKSLRAASNNAPVVTLLTAGYTELTSIADDGLYGVQLANIVTDLATKDAGAADLVAGMKLQGKSSIADMNQLIGTIAYPSAVALIQAMTNCAYPCGGDALTTALDNTSINLPGIVAGPFAYTATNHSALTNAEVFKFNTTTHQIEEVASLPLAAK